MQASSPRGRQGRSTAGARSAALCAALLLVAGCGHRGGGEAAGAPVPVQVGEVVARSLPATIEGIGNITPVTSVAVKSRVDGQIERVLVRDGAEVRRGEVLFQIDRRPFEVALQAAQANLERDQALLAKARDQLRRFQDVFEKGYVSADQLEDVRATARSAAATVAADEAAVAKARLDLEFTTLRSPIDGRVGRVMLQVGNIVKAMDTAPLLTINQMDPVYVEFTVPERYLAELQAAVRQADTSVELVAAGADGTAVERSGPLTFLDNTVDQPTGTIRLRATLSNADRSLWPGQFTRVTIRVPSETPVLVVPAAAVGQSPQGPYVYVVTADGRAEQRSIRLGRTESEYAVVASGVKAGERIVVDGQSRVIPGGEVKVVESEPAKAGS